MRVLRIPESCATNQCSVFESGSDRSIINKPLESGTDSGSVLLNYGSRTQICKNYPDPYNFVKDSKKLRKKNLFLILLPVSQNIFSMLRKCLGRIQIRIQILN